MSAAKSKELGDLTVSMDSIQINRVLIDTIKQQVKSTVQAKIEMDGPEDTLKFILQQINILEDDISSEGIIKRFTFVIYSLIHQDRFGGLNPKQINSLAEIANGLLLIANIRPGNSRLTVLHGELHTILSQINRKLGEHWNAAWEQNLALILSRPDTPPGGELFHSMVTANRALRLGHTNLAMSEYVSAENSGEKTGTMFERLRLGRIQSLRLSGEWQKAKDLIVETEKDSQISKDAALELDWEKLCCDASMQNDIGGIVSAVGRRGKHQELTYISEALLWAYAFSSQTFFERLPTPSSLRKRKGAKDSKYSLTLKMLLALEECYDRDSPLPKRLERLGWILSNRQHLLTLDKEILVLLAAARWLDRSKAKYLGTLTANEYQLMSLRVSLGRCADVFGLAKDLFDRINAKLSA